MNEGGREKAKNKEVTHDTKTHRSNRQNPNRKARAGRERTANIKHIDKIQGNLNSESSETRQSHLGKTT